VSLERLALERLVAGGLLLRLYTDMPGHEADFPGYRPVELGKDDWVVTPGGVSSRVSWTCAEGTDTACVVGGWYLTAPGSNDVLRAAAFLPQAGQAADEQPPYKVRTRGDVLGPVVVILNLAGG
jgi:hypothetical protein